MTGDSAPILASEAPMRPEDAAPRLAPRLVLAIATGQFGTAINTVSLVLVSFPIAAAAVNPDDKQWSLGLLSGVHALVLIVVAPICGFLSDRCTSRFGMRRPFILAGSCIACLAMFAMGLSPNLAGLLAGDALHAVGTGIFVGGFAALVPDHIPQRYRGRVLGVVATMTICAGVVASLLLPAIMDRRLWIFALPGLAGLICSIALVVTLHDRLLTSHERNSQPVLRGLAGRFTFRPVEVPDFSWSWSSKFLLTLGSAMTTTYGIYFLTDQLGVTQSQLPKLITASGLVGLVTAVVGAGVGSYVSDRYRIRKSLIMRAGITAAAGAVTIALAPDIDVYFLGMLISGLAAGMLMPVEGALAIDVLPGEGHESGKYMSLAGLADSIPRSLGPLLAPVIMSLGTVTAVGGYPAIYLAGASMALAGAVIIRRVQGSF